MTESPKDKDQDKADERRDELAKRVLNTPPQPKHGKPNEKKSANGKRDEPHSKRD
ncbi:hypothetical protein DBIPINDM_006817 [Mesorhizobium sp. AR02]|uniref:hypothetical protein n=1 Tax=Mesorhizobium sp. AR02 TaxID=2865837 RepID=UPI00215E1E7C|nr:hypothetical protein [Mesorhizobium sp. AR02]UVK53334.1 hypothetical protein DBIPINDM_006817 [Mesorhizobium sp. AR02]